MIRMRDEIIKKLERGKFMSKETQRAMTRTISRNYLKAERCKDIAQEIKKCDSVKIMIKRNILLWDSLEKYTDTVKDFDRNLLAEAFEIMAKQYEDRSIDMTRFIK